MTSRPSKIVRFIAGALLASACGGCWAEADRVPGAEYLYRTDKMTLTSGNSKDVNAISEIPDPWPRHVGDSRIPVNGDRMVRSVEAFKSGQPAGGTGPATTQVIGVPVGSATPSLSGSSGAAPGQ